MVSTGATGTNLLERAVVRILAVALVSASALALGSCQGSDEAGSSGTSEVSTEVAQAVEAPLGAGGFEDLRAIVVLHGGETVFEEYYDTTSEEYADIRSVTKSVMSTLVGIAIGEGSIRGPEATLGELLPAYRDVMSDRVAATTLDQVLSMTVGFDGEWHQSTLVELLEAPDPVRQTLRDQVRPPGEGFGYSDGTAHLVTAILEESTGTDVVDYARQHLFEPLGIAFDDPFEPRADPDLYHAYAAAGATWVEDPQGRSIGAALLKLRPADLAKIGQLFLDGGVWEGQQVVPADWVATATSPHALDVAGTDDYGYFWWVDEVDGDPAFLAFGFGGQAIRVVPDRDLVIVTTAALPEPDSRGSSNSSVRYLTDEVIAPLFE